MSKVGEGEQKDQLVLSFIKKGAGLVADAELDIQKSDTVPFCFCAGEITLSG